MNENRTCQQPLYVTGQGVKPCGETFPCYLHGPDTRAVDLHREIAAALYEVQNGLLYNETETRGVDLILAVLKKHSDERVRVLEARIAHARLVAYHHNGDDYTPGLMDDWLDGTRDDELFPAPVAPDPPGPYGRDTPDH